MAGESVHSCQERSYDEWSEFENRNLWVDIIIKVILLEFCFIMNLKLICYNLLANYQGVFFYLCE